MSSGLWSYGRSAAGDRVEVAQSCLPTSQCANVVLDDEAAGLSPSPEAVRGNHHTHSDPTAHHCLDDDDDDFGDYDDDVSPLPSNDHRGGAVTITSSSVVVDTEVDMYDDFYVHNDVADVGEWFQKMTLVEDDHGGVSGAGTRGSNVVPAHDSCRRQAREHLAELAQVTTTTSTTTPRLNPVEIVDRRSEPPVTVTPTVKNPVRAQSSTRTLLAKQQMVVAAERRRAHLNSVVQNKPQLPITSTASVPVPRGLRPSSQSTALRSGLRGQSSSRPASSSTHTPSMTTTSRPTHSIFKAPPPLPPPTPSSSSTPHLLSFDQVLAARHAERKLARSALKQQPSPAATPAAQEPVVPLVASRRRDVRVAGFMRNAEKDIQHHGMAVRSDRTRLMRGAFKRMRDIVRVSQTLRSERRQQAILGCMRAVFTGWALLAHKRASATRLRILNAERLASSSMSRWLGVVAKRRQDIQLAPRAHLGFIAAKLLRRMIARRIARDLSHEETLLGLQEVRAWRVKSACWRKMITAMEERAVERARVLYRNRMAQRAAEILNLDPK